MSEENTCKVDPMTLDEAIVHAEDVASSCDTSCAREHRQLAEWLKELRRLRSANVGNAAAMREALMQVSLSCSACPRHNCKGCTRPFASFMPAVRKALTAPARNCDVASDWLHDLYVHFRPPCRREMPPEWVDAIMAFCKWLVSPAEKGGAN